MNCNPPSQVAALNIAFEYEDSTISPLTGIDRDREALRTMSGVFSKKVTDITGRFFAGGLKPKLRPC